MQSLRALFASPGPKADIGAEQDEVFPLHFLDNLSTSRVIVLSETIRFNSVLDPEKLKDGLVRLLEQGDWRKLGGRLRQRPDGFLELHVPREFTQTRPAIGFTSESFNVAAHEHELGRQLPEPTDEPSIQAGPVTFDSLSAVSRGPSTLPEFLASDHPILRVHVTTFTDVTVVALIWPHAIAGALGVKEILSAWSRALRDVNDVPKLLGTRKDVLDGVGTVADASAPYALASKEIKGWTFVKFLVRLLWTVFWRPQVDSRTLCLPREFVTDLKTHSIRELKAAQDGDDSLFLSDGDVLTAWTSRFVAKSRGGNRPGLIFNPLDLTSRLKAPWGTDGVYVQNMTGAIYATVPADILLNKTLGELAYAIRRNVQQQATDEQMRAQLRIFRSLGHTESEPLYGTPDAQLVAFSNWTKFNMFGSIDFGPAIVKSSSSGQAGKPVYMHCQSLAENRFLRDCFVITGKDLQGNYWLSAFLYPEDWTNLQEYMDQTWKQVRH